jgi:serine kinase of HPr protein (carbohydrate metabolism regulator)
MIPPENAASIHASAVLVGGRAVLIRGPSGAGKSQLAFDLILAGRAGTVAPATLIGDDRVRLAARQDELIVSAVTELAGLIEIRGLGIRRCAFRPQAPVGLVVDLAAEDAARLPAPQALRTNLLGIELARGPVAANEPAFTLVVAALTTNPAF